MKFEYLIGDVIKSDEPVIAHGCNTQGFMGSGIALQVAHTYPDAEVQYRKACLNREFVIGTAQAIWIKDHDAQRLLFNLGTQERTGPDARAWAIYLSFANMAERCYRLGINRVAIPRIGCGVGGMVWEDSAKAMSEAIEQSSGPYMTIAVYDLP